MMNKKAKSDKTLTFPIFIIIILISALALISFVLLSISKNTPAKESVENLLLQKINFAVNNEEQEMFFFDVGFLLLQEYLAKEPSHNENVAKFKAKLNSLLNEKNNCFYINSEFTLPAYSGKLTNENKRISMNSEEIKKIKPLKNSYKINGKKYAIEHYLGECP